MNKRLTALILAMAMALSMLTGCGSNQVNADSSAPALTDAEQQAATAISSAAEQLLSTHSSTSGKEETVYIIADANGNPSKTIVSAWLKNEKGEATLQDKTDLTDLTNVKGDGSYTDNGDGTITWDTNGTDVYYQGTTSKDLPVTVSVRYELDGKLVSADELEGASGHLKMTFQYHNNTAKTIQVNGKDATIYQPFVMISGTLLDNEKASNITVTNGQVINSGENAVVVGLAMPGLREGLGLDDLKDSNDEPLDITIPESVELEADVTDFSLMPIMTVASNSALEQLGLDDIDSADDLKDSMNDLKEATQKLIDGAGDLNKGMKDLSKGTDKLDSGVNDLNDGAKKLNDGTGTLSKGLSTALSGSKKLLAEGFEGEKGAVSGAKALADGAKALNDAVQSAEGVSLTKKQKQTISSAGSKGAAAYASDFASAITASLAKSITVNEETMKALKKTAADSAAAAIEKQKADIAKSASESAVASLKKSNVGSNVASAAMKDDKVQELVKTLTAVMVSKGLDEKTAKEQAEATVQGMLASVAQSTAESVAGSVAESVASSVATDVASSVASSVAEQTATGVASTIAGTIGSDATTKAVSAKLEDSLGQLGAGIATQTADGLVKEVNSGLTSTFKTMGQVTQQLSDGAAKLSTGIETIYQKTSELSSGLKELDDGAATLKKGTQTLYEGTSKMDKSMVDLLDGVGKLLDGTNDLVDGVNEYNEEGIEKLTSLILDDLDGTWQRLKAIQEYSEEYTSFSGVLPDMDCSVKFIFSMNQE